MLVKNVLPIVFLSAILFTIIFYNHPLGINLVIFELFFVIWLYATRQINFSSRIKSIGTVGFLLTSVSTLITYSVFSCFIHFIAVFLYIGILNYPSVKSFINTMGISISSFFKSQIEFFKNITTSKVMGKNAGAYLWKFRIFIIPTLIISIFLFIYKASNPIFDEITMKMGSFLQNILEWIFSDIELPIFFTFLLGIVISNFLYFRTRNQSMEKKDSLGNDGLIRKRKKQNTRLRPSGLKNELKAAIFLLFILNIILLILNITDIYLVWFNFEWDGHTLKQFVHEGTYLLIFSILISIALVLYFFRGNLNFYSKNKLLKTLCYVWLAQNTILAISVGVRNYWYIEYFSLAYKRIGVAIFLLLTLYGLYSVFVKIKFTKSRFFLFRTNAMALYVVLVLSSIINWDTLIAKYNFSRSDTAFLHLDFMAELSDKTLPYLEKPLSELKEIAADQRSMFPQNNSHFEPEQYHQKIENRKKAFLLKWESKSILSWNLPEYIAYQKLK